MGPLDIQQHTTFLVNGLGFWDKVGALRPVHRNQNRGCLNHFRPYSRVTDTTVKTEYKTRNASIKVGRGGHIPFMQAGLRTGHYRITVSGIPKLPKLLCNFYGTYMYNLPMWPRAGNPRNSSFLWSQTTRRHILEDSDLHGPSRWHVTMVTLRREREQKRGSKKVPCDLSKRLENGVPCRKISYRIITNKLWWCTGTNIRYIKTITVQTVPVQVAARPKALVCGRSPAETVGSNPTDGMDVRLLWVFCVVR